MMKTMTPIITVLLIVFFISAYSLQPRREAQDTFDFPVLQGPYLGQKPPGMTPEIFAPGIISTDEWSESIAGFGMAGELFIFIRFLPNNPNILYVTELKDNKWMNPYPAPFNTPFSDWDCNFAPDGFTFYFSSNRPVSDGVASEKPWNIWVTQITDTGWADPVMLEYPVNTEEHNEGYASVTKDGTLYFFSVGRGDGYGQDDLYRAVLTDGKYSQVENLGGCINTEFAEADPFISPDEDYIIFCSNRPGGFGTVDMYVSFRKEDGSWTEPKNLGEAINSASRDFIPSVTADGRFFFFRSEKSGRGDVYWVDAKVIEKSRPDK